MDEIDKQLMSPVERAYRRVRFTEGQPASEMEVLANLLRAKGEILDESAREILAQQENGEITMQDGTTKYLGKVKEVMEDPFNPLIS